MEQQKLGNNLNSLQSGQSRIKLVDPCAGMFSAVKRNELNLYVSTWVELKDGSEVLKKQDAECYI